MEYYLPNASEAALHKAKKASKIEAKKLSIQVNGDLIPVAEYYGNGFAVLKKYSMPKSAHIELWQGSTSLFTGLIHYADEEQDMQRFEFKRVNAVASQAPKDFAEDDVLIAGLLSAS